MLLLGLRKMCSQVAVASSSVCRAFHSGHGRKMRLGFCAEPGGHRLGIAAQADGRRRDGMESLADRAAPIGDRPHEHLRDVVGMDVMNRLHAEIGQRQLFALASVVKIRGLKCPAGLSGAQPGPTMWPGCAIVAGKPFRRASSSRNASICRLRIPYSPNGLRGCGLGVGTATLGPCTQMVPQSRKCCTCPRSASTRCCALSRVKQIMSMTMSGFRSRTFRPKVPVLLLGIAVERDGPHRLPRGVRPVRFAFAAANVDDLEAGFDEAWHQVGADMTAATDDHDARHGRSPERADDAIEPGRGPVDACRGPTSLRCKCQTGWLRCLS